MDGRGGEGHFEFYWGKKNVAKEWRNQVKQDKWPQWRDFTQSIISLSCTRVEQIPSSPCNWGEWHPPVYPGLLRLLLLCLQFGNRATFILSIPVWIRCSISLNVILQSDTNQEVSHHGGHCMYFLLSHGQCPFLTDPR